MTNRIGSEKDSGKGGRRHSYAIRRIVVELRHTRCAQHGQIDSKKGLATASGTTHRFNRSGTLAGSDLLRQSVYSRMKGCGDGVYSFGVAQVGPMAVCDGGGIW